MGSKIFKPPIKSITAINGFVPRHRHFRRALLIGSRRNDYQTLIKFDISLLPRSAAISSGILKVHLYDKYLPNQTSTVTVHQILSTWRRGRVVEFNPLPIDSTSVDNNEHTCISFDITPLVIKWHTGEAANLGVLLKLADHESPGLSNLLVFYSKDVCNSQCWPSLEVLYGEPGPHPGCSETLDFDISVSTRDNVNTTATLHVQRFNYTYYIINTGTNDATLSMQLSPDGTNWLTDEPPQVIAPGVMLPFVPNFIAKLARITYQSTTPNRSTNLDIRVRGYSS